MRQPESNTLPERNTTPELSIQIENPRPGEATHTSHNRATYLCQTQQAFMTEGGKLCMLAYERKENYEPARKAFWWNGSEAPWKMHRPGEVRS